MAQFYTPRKRVVLKKTFSVTVSALDAFGQGMAHADGKTIFIPNALPGETVDVTRRDEKKNIVHADVLKRHNDSPARVSPRCQHYGECGGCQMQHIAQPLQQKIKSDALINILMRETKSSLQAPEILAGDAYGYRRRARFALYYQKKMLLMGFRKAHNNDIVLIQECPILTPALENLIQPLYACLSRLSIVANLGHVELTDADNGVVVMLRLLSVLPASDLACLHDFAAQHQLILFIQTHDDKLECLFGAEPFYRLNEAQLFFSPRHFIQVNRDINQKMVEHALSWLALRKHDRVLDLFCGMGNFSLSLAPQVANVIGIEGVPELVEKSKENAERNGITNVQFYSENLDTELAPQFWTTLPIDKVLLDPARAGALTALSYVVKLAPSHIVYVSCHPATLARDCHILTQAGYHIAKVCMIEMFPQTKHLESMILLTKE